MKTELRVYVIGALPVDDENEVRRLINGADLCIVGDSNPRPGFRFDTGDRWGVVEIVRFESKRIAICKRVGQ